MAWCCSSRYFWFSNSLFNVTFQILYIPFESLLLDLKLLEFFALAFELRLKLWDARFLFLQLLTVFLLEIIHLLSAFLFCLLHFFCELLFESLNLCQLVSNHLLVLFLDFLEHLLPLRLLLAHLGVMGVDAILQVLDLAKELLLLFLLLLLLNHEQFVELLLYFLNVTLVALVLLADFSYFVQ